MELIVKDTTMWITPKMFAIFIKQRQILPLGPLTLLNRLQIDCLGKSNKLLHASEANNFFYFPPVFVRHQRILAHW
jgi:hypothetical protein